MTDLTTDLLNDLRTILITMSKLGDSRVASRNRNMIEMIQAQNKQPVSSTPASPRPALSEMDFLKGAGLPQQTGPMPLSAGVPSRVNSTRSLGRVCQPEASPWGADIRPVALHHLKCNMGTGKRRGR